MIPNLFQLGLVGDSASLVTITVDAVCDVGTTGLAAAQLVITS
jgi:hypothetical protein